MLKFYAAPKALPTIVGVSLAGITGWSAYVSIQGAYYITETDCSTNPLSEFMQIDDRAYRRPRALVDALEYIDGMTLIKLPHQRP